jgi:hypothetical protein
LAELEESGNEAEEEAKIRKLIGKIDIHRQNKEHQREQYRAQIEYLPSSSIVVTQDFTVIDLLLSTDFSKNSVTDLIFVVEKKEKEVIQRHYIDIICQQMKAKNNVNFVKTAWEAFIKHPLLSDVDRILLWSYGGPKHFKTATTMKFFCDLMSSSGKFISYNFFASYHGHSLCDSHAATVNNTVLHERKQLDSLKRGREGKNQLSTAAHLKKLVEEKVRNTEGNHTYRLCFGIISFVPSVHPPKDNPKQKWDEKSCRENSKMALL